MKNEFAGWCRIIKEGTNSYEEWEVRHLYDPKAVLIFEVRGTRKEPSITLRRVLQPNQWYPGQGEHSKVIGRAFRFLEKLSEEETQRELRWASR